MFARNLCSLRGVWHDAVAATATGAYRIALAVNGAARPALGSEQFQFNGWGRFQHTQTAQAGGAGAPLPLYVMTGGAHTTLPILQATDVDWSGLARTVGFSNAGGTLATQRQVVVGGATYTAAAALAITALTNLYVEAPRLSNAGGALPTATRRNALWLADLGQVAAGADTSSTDILQLTHETGGTAGVAFGVGTLSRLANAAGTLIDASRIAATWAGAAAGGEGSRLDFSVYHYSNAGGAGALANTMTLLGPATNATAGSALWVGTGTPATTAWRTRICAAYTTIVCEISVDANSLTGMVGTSSNNNCGLMAYGSTLITLTTGRRVEMNSQLFTVAAAAGAIFDATYWKSNTHPITGGATNITTATGFNYINVRQQTVDKVAAGASVVSWSATVYIAGACTFTTNVTCTNPYALWVDADNVRLDGNILLGPTPPVTCPGLNAVGTLCMSNSATAPANSVDLCHLYCADNGAGHATLAVYAEEVPVASVATASTHKIPILWNGTLYNLLATTV